VRCFLCSFVNAKTRLVSISTLFSRALTLIITALAPQVFSFMCFPCYPLALTTHARC
jgi:hypothetical protein